MSQGESATGRDLWQTLRERTTLFDLLLIGSVPAVLLATMSLPIDTRRHLAFEYADPSLWTAFASSFAHITTPHLAVNLAGYSLVVSLAYCLSALGGHRRRFRVTFVSLVLACPILIPYLNLTIVRRSASLGFSGVLLALYGYLPFALAVYVQEVFDFDDSRRTAPLLFFVGVSLITGLTLVAVLTNPVSVPVRGVTVSVTVVLVGTLASLLLALVLVVSLYAFSVQDGADDLRPKARGAIVRPGHAELTIVAIAVFLAVPIVTFPIEPLVDGGVVNIYAHLVGYSLGFIGTYVTATLEGRLFGSTGHGWT